MSTTTAPDSSLQEATLHRLAPRSGGREEPSGCGVPHERRPRRASWAAGPCVAAAGPTTSSSSWRSADGRAHCAREAGSASGARFARRVPLGQSLSHHHRRRCSPSFVRWLLRYRACLTSPVQPSLAWVRQDFSLARRHQRRAPRDFPRLAQEVSTRARVCDHARFGYASR